MGIRGRSRLVSLPSGGPAGANVARKPYRSPLGSGDGMGCGMDLPVGTRVGKDKSFHSTPCRWLGHARGDKGVAAWHDAVVVGELYTRVLSLVQDKRPGAYPHTGTAGRRRRAQGLDRKIQACTGVSELTDWIHHSWWRTPTSSPSPTHYKSRDEKATRTRERTDACMLRTINCYMESF